MSDNMMTFETLDAQVTARKFGGNNSERSDARVARVNAFFALFTNALFLYVGKFLSNMVNGKSLAQWLSEGREITLKAINIPDGNGKVRTFPLPEGFVISLKTLNIWGCFACHSAHGSGIAPSKEVDYALLAKNEFWYNPASRQLFVISDTCWKQYVENRTKLASGKWSDPGKGIMGQGTDFSKYFKRLSEVPGATLDATIAMYGKDASVAPAPTQAPVAAPPAPQSPVQAKRK